jgi:hypothetical protein
LTTPVELQRLLSSWQKSLGLAQPQTVIKWHRLSFCLLCRWKSSTRHGRPHVEQQLLTLIRRRMWQANPTWGSPRIQAELDKRFRLSASTFLDEKFSQLFGANAAVTVQLSDTELTSR